MDELLPDESCRAVSVEASFSSCYCVYDSRLIVTLDAFPSHSLARSMVGVLPFPYCRYHSDAAAKLENFMENFFLDRHQVVGQSECFSGPPPGPLRS